MDRISNFNPVLTHIHAYYFYITRILFQHDYYFPTSMLQVYHLYLSHIQLISHTTSVHIYTVTYNTYNMLSIHIKPTMPTKMLFGRIKVIMTKLSLMGNIFYNQSYL